MNTILLGAMKYVCEMDKDVERVRDDTLLLSYTHVLVNALKNGKAFLKVTKTIVEWPTVGSENSPLQHLGI